MTSTHLYVRTAVKDITYKIKYVNKKKLTWSQAKPCSEKLDAGNWNRIMHERVRHERIELFFDFKMSQRNELYVTFDRFAASFDLMQQSFKPQTVFLGQESQYIVGTSAKDASVMGLFQEASDPEQAKISQSKLFSITYKEGLGQK